MLQVAELEADAAKLAKAADRERSKLQEALRREGVAKEALQRTHEALQAAQAEAAAAVPSDARGDVGEETQQLRTRVSELEAVR